MNIYIILGVSLIAIVACVVVFMKSNTIDILLHVFTRSVSMASLLGVLLVLAGSVIQLIKAINIPYFYLFWSWFGLLAGVSLYITGFVMLYNSHLSKKSFWRVPDPKEKSPEEAWEEKLLINAALKNAMPEAASKSETILMKATLFASVIGIVFGTASKVIKDNITGNILLMICMAMLILAGISFLALIFPFAINYLKGIRKKNI
jgi:hypothetical protein